MSAFLREHGQQHYIIPWNERLRRWVIGSGRDPNAQSKPEELKTMKRLILAIGCILLAGPALAQSIGEKTGINSALGVAPTTADFVKEVAISDMFELESNRLAQQKGNAQEKS